MSENVTKLNPNEEPRPRRGKTGPPREGRTAFGQVFDMEETLNQIERMIATLFLVAEAAERHNANVGSALHGIAFTLDEKFTDLDKRYDRLFQTLKLERDATTENDPMP